MKYAAEAIMSMSQIQIRELEKTGSFLLDFGSDRGDFILNTNDVEIYAEDIPGWKVANSGALTVALDITITDKLRDEGIAREIVNRIQNLRKEKKFEVTDKISVRIKDHKKINTAIINNLDYIRAEILADTFEIVNEINGKEVEIEVEEGVKTMVEIDRIKQLN
jgi:isoleucyl-tRNA synthetase